MSEYQFETDQKAEAFCNKIAKCMVSMFSISNEEAVARINQEWAGLLSIVGDDIIYHDTAEDWAKDIYWGHELLWWIQGEERERQKLPPLIPKPLRQT